MKRRVQRLNIAHTGRFCAVFYLLFFCVPTTLVVLINDDKTQDIGANITEKIIAIAGSLAGVVFAGFFGGVITALLYNISSKWVGGIEITLEESPKPPPRLR